MSDVNDRLIGLSVEDARALCASMGLQLRVTREDGEPQLITMDLRRNRVNVHVVDGRIAEIAQQVGEDRW